MEPTQKISSNSNIFISDNIDQSTVGAVVANPTNEEVVTAENHFKNVPNDVIKLIFHEISAEDLCKASLVDRRFNKILKEDQFQNKIKKFKNEKFDKTFLSLGQYYRGTLSREESQSILADKEVGSWLIRYSTNNKSMVLSKKKGEGKYSHWELSQAETFSSLPVLVIKEKFVGEATKNEESSFKKSENTLLCFSQYYHGILSREEAKETLKDKEVGSWLISYSPNNKIMVLDVINEKNEFTHYGFQQNDTIASSGLEQMVDLKKFVEFSKK